MCSLQMMLKSLPSSHHQGDGVKTEKDMLILQQNDATPYEVPGVYIIYIPTVGPLIKFFSRLMRLPLGLEE